MSVSLIDGHIDEKVGIKMNTDITYCINKDCSFKDCERHHTQLSKLPNNTPISIANFANVCDRYLNLKKVKRNKRRK